MDPFSIFITVVVVGLLQLVVRIINSYREQVPEQTLADSFTSNDQDTQTELVDKDIILDRCQQHLEDLENNFYFYTQYQAQLNHNIWSALNYTPYYTDDVSTGTAPVFQHPSYHAIDIEETNDLDEVPQLAQGNDLSTWPWDHLPYRPLNF